jgi:NAD(P)-dependent dehydrogenase (short-subunit alcohol dehydrogenase family)
MNELFNLSDDVAVVTGAGRGIGEGIATTLAEAGAAVGCAARRLDEIERVAAGIRKRGGRAIAVATDVTDKAAVEALASAAVSEFGHLDIWVNNAGGSPIQTPLVDLDVDEWEAKSDLATLERRLRLPMRRLGTPVDLGAAVLYLVSPASSWVTGQMLSIDGGM